MCGGCAGHATDYQNVCVLDHKPLIVRRSAEVLYQMEPNMLTYRRVRSSYPPKSKRPNRPSNSVLFIVIMLMKLSVFGVWGCAGPARISLFSGTCDAQFERCTKGCQSLKDPLDCEIRCRFYGKTCESAQAGGTDSAMSAKNMIGDYEILMVDLESRNILSSKAAIFKIEGAHHYAQKSYLLAPGATLTTDFFLPANVRQADLVLRHAPAGTAVGCYVTIHIGDQTIGQRYAPPRSLKNRLRAEKWSLTQALTTWTTTADGRKTARLTIHNNKALGSTDPYRISSIELYYRTMTEQ